ncbi:MAG: DUF2169 domain-containing protein [Polyangiales bacterium]
MELSNTTPLAARASAWDGFEPGRRDGMVVAKATYQYTAEGALTLDASRPFPLFVEDERTPFGLMPRDDLARDPEGFEVIFLGSAYAPRGSSVREMTVSLRVGEVERTLWVTGDRRVDGDRITPPEPFTRMDLGWSNAFGGAAEVMIDRDAAVVVTDPRNPAGKGFDPRPQAEALCATLRAPEGYPLVLQGDRWLPNVEHPSRRIAAATDAPDPAGWATLPLSAPAHATRSLDLEASQREGAAVLTRRTFHRAVDEWIVERPAEGAEVTLRGLDPDGTVRFALPALRVACDFMVGEVATTLELLPEALLIVGPWRRFTLLYRARFHYWENEGEFASARLWCREVGGAR